VKQLKDRLEVRFKTEVEKRNELESDLLDKVALLKNQQKKFEADFAQLIETNVLDKVNQLLMVSVTDRIVMSDKSVQMMERKVPISEYVEDIKISMEGKQLTNFQTLDE
jgi:uncharacterized protein YaiL (DUF2058 family)